MKEPDIDDLIEKLIADFADQEYSNVIFDRKSGKILMSYSGHKDLRMAMMQCYEKGFNDAKRKRVK